MSQDNVEIVRRVYDAWNRRDSDALLALAAPEIEYVNSPAAVEPGTRRGRAEYASVLRAQWEIVGDARVEIESVHAHGNDVFVMLRMARSLQGSKAQVNARVGMLTTCRGGRMTRQEVIPPEAFRAALEAAGLSE